MSTGWALTVSFLLLLANAFFVGAEFAAMAVRRSSLEPLADGGSRRAGVVLEALERLGSMLATAQLGITVCSVSLGALAEAALHHLIEPLFAGWGVPEAWAGGAALALALLIVSYLHVVVGEMIPKNIAIAGPERSALVLVPPLYVIANALRALVRAMEWVAKSLVRLFGIEPRDEIASAFTAEEVAHIVGESHREGLIEEERHGLVAKTLEFSDKLASDVAVGTGSLTCVPLGATPADIERLVARHGFSRYPVTDAAGEIAGYLHLKDVLYADDERHDLPVPPKRIRRLATVREEDEVEAVLATMQLTGAHLARVIDESGTVRGVVFLEDVLNDAAQRAAEVIAEKNPDLAGAADVAEMVGVGAVVFNDLKRERVKDIEFTWEEVLSFEGDTGPYVQYTHARLASILRKLAERDEGGADPDWSAVAGAAPILTAMGHYPGVLESAAEKAEPSVVTSWVLSFCRDLNTWIAKERVLGQEPGVTAARARLVAGARQVVANALAVLGVAAPDRM